MSLFGDARPLPDAQQTFVADLRRGMARGHTMWRRVADSWNARRQHARELEELYRFTDRDLADLGLSKSDLPAIEKGVYHRE
jgi:uncharacterized protein YjiS (DUF1127 family)